MYVNCKGIECNMTQHDNNIEVLKKYFKDIRTSFNFDLSPDISIKQIENATKRFAKDLDPSSIIGFYDTTILNSGKSGYIFTDVKVYYIEIFGKPKTLWYDDIIEINLLDLEKKDCDRILQFKLLDGTSTEWTDSCLNKTPLLEFLSELLNLNKITSEEIGREDECSGACDQQTTKTDLLTTNPIITLKHENRLWNANYLKWHPILKEPSAFRYKYYKTLQNFCSKSTEDDQFSDELLTLFHNAFLSNDDIDNLDLEVEELNNEIFALFPYHYVFIIDCLYITSFDNPEKGRRVIENFKKLLTDNAQVKLEKLYQALFIEKEIISGYDHTYSLQEAWQKNNLFLSQSPIRYLVTANMSAGKSTLLNALVGKRINRVRNTACTAKIHYIQNQPFEDGFNYEYDHLLDLNASESVLLEDNIENQTGEIFVGTYFRNYIKPVPRVCFIDTPGVNSSTNKDHKEITEKTLASKEFDGIIYVMNAGKLGTEDEYKHLKHISEIAGEKPIIFIVNKLDKFRDQEDNVYESLKSINSELHELNFTNFIICPVSAYAGYLAKRKLWGDILSDDELDDFQLIYKKMRKHSYSLSKYYPKLKSVEPYELFEERQNKSSFQALQLLKESGLLGLEELLYYYDTNSKALFWQQFDFALSSTTDAIKKTSGELKKEFSKLFKS